MDSRWRPGGRIARRLVNADRAGANANVGGGAGRFTGNPAFAPSVADATNAQGVVIVVSVPAHRTLVLLLVRGLPAGRSFGAHVHRDSCSSAFGGPHYQAPDPTTPTTANADENHEVWLEASRPTRPGTRISAVAPFEILPGARSVVIHQADHTAAEERQASDSPVSTSRCDAHRGKCARGLRRRR